MGGPLSVTTNINGAYKFNVYRKNTKLPIKQKTISDDLHRSKRVSSYFDKEITVVKVYEGLLPIVFH